MEHRTKKRLQDTVSMMMEQKIHKIPTQGSIMVAQKKKLQEEADKAAKEKAKKQKEMDD